MIENLKKHLNVVNNPKDLEKLLNKVEGLLKRNEELYYIAIQKKHSINLSPDFIVLTNKRIIFCKPKKLGLPMEFQVYLWKDIAVVI
jgi:hypothetical protein